MSAFGICLTVLQGSKSDVATVLRPLGLDDFIQSKAKVRNLKFELYCYYG
jgi:hypothetical protein